MSEVPTKVASPDMQLAILISMGFDAESAEQALMANDWKVDDSIDYLLAAGISMNPENVVSEDDVKSVERRQHSLRRVRLEPPSMIASNKPERLRTRQERPADSPVVLGGVTRRYENMQEELEDEWVSDDATPPRRTTGHHHQRRSQQRHDGDVDTALSLPNHASRRNTHARQTNAMNEPHSHRGPASVQSVTDEREIQRYRRQREPALYDANDPLGWDPSSIKHASDMPKRSFEDADDAKTYPGATAIYGVPKYATSKETALQATSRRQAGDDDISTMAIAGSSVLTGSPSNSLEAATSSSRDVNRKDIQRLYILVCVAIALVIICTGVTVALVLTLRNNGGGDPSAQDDSIASTTTPAPTTSPTTALAPQPATMDITSTEPPTTEGSLPTTTGPTTAGAGRLLELQMDDLTHYLRGGRRIP